MNSNRMVTLIGILVILVELHEARATHNSNKKLVIAHRGASGYLPEHTHEAKVAAFIMGADYLEQDLVLTKDNVPIVSHDIHLDEVTNVADVFPTRKRADSRYYAIDFTFDEIKSLKVAERFHYDNRSRPYFPLRFPLWQSEFSIPGFADEIELVKGMETSFGNIYQLDKSGHLTQGLVRKAGIYPEIKDPEFHRQEGRANFSEIVLAVLDKYGYRTRSDPVFLQCFDPLELRRIRDDLKSNLTLIQLMPVEFDESQSDVNWNSVDGLHEIVKFANGIGPNLELLIDQKIFTETGKIRPSAFLLEAKQLRLAIHPYTLRIDQLPFGIGDYETLLRVAFDELDVDGVFTDFPDLTSQYLKLKNGAASSLRAFATNNWITLAVFLIFYIYFDKS